jgi:hypothetical protein
MDLMGGLEAMMWELKGRDISGWHPRQNVPHTDLLDEQVAMSLSLEGVFWKDVVESGDLPEHWLLEPRAAKDWLDGKGVYIFRDSVMQSFFSQNSNQHTSRQNGRMGRLLKRVGASEFRPGGEERRRCWLIPGHNSALWKRLT